MDIRTMYQNKDLEYIFWLDFWRKDSDLWPNSGQFKCIVTRERIHVIPVDSNSGKELDLRMSSIQRCKLGNTGNFNKHVILLLNSGKLLLSPVNPIDPRGIQNYNHDEASALINVIETFRLDVDPELDANAYMRQLPEKNNLNGFSVPDIKWDKHTSPWTYYELYGDKFLPPKLFIKTIVIIVAVIIIGLPILFGLVHLLDLLNII